MRFFDSHTHIQSPKFDSDRREAIGRARDAGVAGQLVLGWDVASSEAAIALAGDEDGVMAAAGCHPHSADAMDDASLGTLAEMAGDPRVVAVGEIGLDFYRNFSAHDKQIDVFKRQLETAGEVSKPAAIHCREAADTLLPIVEAWSHRMGGRLPDGRRLGVMHYFSEGMQLAQRYVELGFLISIHCSVTYPNAKQLHEVARRMPLSHLVIETDSPFGPPQSRRGERNEPAYVIDAAAKVAELRAEPIEQVAEATTDNAMRLLEPAAAQRTTAGPRAQQTV